MKLIRICTILTCKVILLFCQNQSIYKRRFVQKYNTLQSEMVKCLALFSGGLDSSLAIMHVKSLGIDVIALNFVSHFFGGANAKIEAMAKQLQVPVLFVDAKEHQFTVTVHPEHGRGKNFNACIDCHAKMVQIAGAMLPKYGADFIITGEVLGQRPMSQNAAALQTVAKLSGFPDRLLRPLSGKLLPESPANKFIPREKLLDISGRSTARQTELAAKFNIVEYPSHAGGCQLTEPQFGDKMKILEKDGVLVEEIQFAFPLMRHGRLLRFQEKQYALVGRNEVENKYLIEKGAQYVSYITSPNPITKPGEQLPGPAVLLLDFTSIKLTPLERKEIVLNNADMEDLKPGECTKCNEIGPFIPKKVFLEASIELLDFGLKAYSRFCKGKGKVKSEVEVYLKEREAQPSYTISPALDEETLKTFDKYMINK